MVTAVTGGIAEGKSTVLDYLAELGFRTASADSVARTVFEDPTVNALLAGAVDQKGPISPIELRSALFGNPDLRRLVNRIMHPRIIDLIRRSAADFVEIPLLIETCLQGEFDSVWVVTCGLGEQKRRLVARYGNTVDVDVLIAAQLPTEVKIAFADEVFRTNCDFQTVRRNVSEALQRRFELG